MFTYIVTVNLRNLGRGVEYQGDDRQIAMDCFSYYSCPETAISATLEAVCPISGEKTVLKSTMKPLDSDRLE